VSFAELQTITKTLSLQEKVQLIKMLADDIAGGQTEADNLLNELGFSTGATLEYHQIEVSEKDMQYVLSALEEEKANLK
jgi:hypothetical protein